MKKLIRLLKRIRVKFSRSNRRTKRAVICMAALSMVALLALKLTVDGLRAKWEEDRMEAARLEYENSQLEDKIENAGSLEGAEDAARDEGYVHEGDTVIEIK